MRMMQAFTNTALASTKLGFMDSKDSHRLVVPSTAGRVRRRPQSAAAVLAGNALAPTAPSNTRNHTESNRGLHDAPVDHRLQAMRGGASSLANLAGARQSSLVYKRESSAANRHAQSLNRLTSLYGSTTSMPLAPPAPAVSVFGEKKKRRKSKKLKAASRHAVEGDLDVMNRESKVQSVLAKAAIHGPAVPKQRTRPASAVPRLGASTASNALPAHSSTKRSKQPRSSNQDIKHTSSQPRPVWDSTTGHEADLSRSAPFRRLHRTRPGSGKPSTLKRAQPLKTRSSPVHSSGVHDGESATGEADLSPRWPLPRTFAPAGAAAARATSHASRDRSRSVMSAVSPEGSLDSGRFSPGEVFMAKRAAAQAKDLKAHGIKQSHAASVQSLTDEVLAAEPTLRRTLVQLAKVSASCAAFGWSDTGMLLDAGTATGQRRGASDTAGIEERGALEHTVDDFVALQQHVSNLQQNQYVRSLAQLRATLKAKVQQLAGKAVEDFQRRMAKALRRQPQLRTQLTSSGGLVAEGAASRLHLLARSVGKWDGRLEAAYTQWVADHKDEAVIAARTHRRQANAGAQEEAAAAGARVAHMASVRMGGFLRSAQLAAELDSRQEETPLQAKTHANRAQQYDASCAWLPLQPTSASSLPPPTPAHGLLGRRTTGMRPTTPNQSNQTLQAFGVNSIMPAVVSESASTRALRQHSVVLQDPASVHRVIVGGQDSDSSLVNTDSDVDIEGALDAPLEGQISDSDSSGSRPRRITASATPARQRRLRGKRGLHSNTAEALIRSVKVSEERSKIARRLERERRRLVRGAAAVGHGASGHSLRSSLPPHKQTQDAGFDSAESELSCSESDTRSAAHLHASSARPAVDTALSPTSAGGGSPLLSPKHRQDPIVALYGRSQLQRTASMRKQLSAASIEADLDATPAEATQALELAHATVTQVILARHFSTISKAMKARRKWLATKVVGQRKQHAQASSALLRSQHLQAQRAAFKRDVGRTRLRLRHMFGHLLSPVGTEQQSVLWQRDIHTATKASALLAALAPPAVLAVLRMACHMLPAGLQWMVLGEHEMQLRRPPQRLSAVVRADRGLGVALPPVSLSCGAPAESRLSTQPLGGRFEQLQSKASKSTQPAGRRVTLPGLAAAALITVHLRHSSHQLGGLSLLHSAAKDAPSRAPKPQSVRGQSRKDGFDVLDDTSREYAAVRRLIVRCAATSLIMEYKHALRHPEHMPALPDKFENARNTLRRFLPDPSHVAQGVRNAAAGQGSGFDIPQEDLLLALTVWAVADQASHQAHDTLLSRQFASYKAQQARGDLTVPELGHPLGAWVLPSSSTPRVAAADPGHPTIGLGGVESTPAAVSFSSTAIGKPQVGAALHKVSAPHKLSLRDVWDNEDSAALQQSKLQSATSSQSALTRYRADRIGVSVDRFLKRASTEAAASAGTLVRNGVSVSSVQQLDARPVSQAASRRHGAVASTVAARAAKRGMSVAAAAHALLRVIRGHVARQYVWALRYVTDPSAVALAFVSADDNGNGVVEPSELASLLVMLGGYSATAVRHARAHAQVHSAGANHGRDWLVGSVPSGPGAGSTLLVDMGKLGAAMGAAHGAGITMEQFSAWWIKHVPHSANVADQLELVAAARSLYSGNIGVMQRWRQLARACNQARENAALASIARTGGES